MTLVAVIADTHMPRGSRALPPECLSRLRSAELILHVGDVVAAAVLEELREVAPVEAVAGNMDDATLQATLPERRVLVVAGVSIGMVHVPGPRTGRAQRLRQAFPSCQIVVYGHTHVPEVDRSGDVWILNPGSPTERRSAPTRTMLMLEIGAGRIGAELVPLGT